MKSYPTYESLAVDLDLHFFDKVSILKNAGNRCYDGKWLIVTDDGHCHLFDKDGNLDDINKITFLQERFIRKNIKKIIIPDSVTSICENSFRDCVGLTSVTLPDSVKSIGFGAFWNCSSLTNVTIPDSVTNIWSSVFWNCSSLTNVTIPDSVTNIGDWAFEFCSGLTNTTIGNSVTNIGSQAFFYCKNLKNIFFKVKTLKQVRSVKYYPWGIEDENIIKTL